MKGAPFQALWYNFARYLLVRRLSIFESQAIAVACALSAAIIRFLLNPVVHDQVPVVVFYPFILIASIFGGTWSGVSTLILGGIIADYFWLPPHGFDLTANSSVTLVGFAIVASLTITFARMIRALIEVNVAAKEHATLLARETKHRSLNMFGLVQAIATQTARNALTVSEYHQMFLDRLGALAHAQQLMSDDPDEPPDLRKLLQRVLQPFGLNRFAIDGPEVKIPSHLASSFALLFHELATNATKYGALSVPAGHITLYWQTVDKQISVKWQELNGPAVKEPERKGFGAQLLATAFPPEHGQAALSYLPQGVRCTIKFMAC